MSINRCSPDPNSAAAYWAGPRQLHHQADAAAGAMFCRQSPAYSFNLNNEDDEELLEEQAADDGELTTNNRQSEGEDIYPLRIPKEPLFEKPLTPSDVGKLNRLVIPKQHAEKHFPLNGSGGGESGEKGLLLSFEDELGKPWRFRYSYWNSSQSYVLTKGWSRFVKEKRLDAGDIVLFARHGGRLFIGWRRRNTGGGEKSGVAQPPPGGGGGGGGGWSRVLYPSQYPYPRQHHQGSSSLPYQSVSPHPVTEKQATVVGSGNNNWKRLRLFGVNLEWWEAGGDHDESDQAEGSPAMSSQGRAHGPHPIYDHQPYADHRTAHMDMNFSAGDVYRHG